MTLKRYSALTPTPHYPRSHPRLNHLHNIHKTRKELQELRKQAQELTEYLTSYDQTAVKELMEREARLKAYLERTQKEAWLIEALRQFSKQKVKSDKNCRACPFFQKWLREAYNKTFDVELVEVEGETEREATIDA